MRQINGFKLPIGLDQYIGRTHFCFEEVRTHLQRLSDLEAELATAYSIRARGFRLVDDFHQQSSGFIAASPRPRCGGYVLEQCSDADWEMIVRFVEQRRGRPLCGGNGTYQGLLWRGQDFVPVPTMVRVVGDVDLFWQTSPWNIKLDEVGLDPSQAIRLFERRIDSPIRTLLMAMTHAIVQQRRAVTALRIWRDRALAIAWLVFEPGSDTEQFGLDATTFDTPFDEVNLDRLRFVRELEFDAVDRSLLRALALVEDDAPYRNGDFAAEPTSILEAFWDVFQSAWEQRADDDELFQQVLKRYPHSFQLDCGTII